MLYNELFSAFINRKKFRLYFIPLTIGFLGGFLSATLVPHFYVKLLSIFRYNLLIWAYFITLVWAVYDLIKMLFDLMVYVRLSSLDNLCAFLKHSIWKLSLIFLAFLLIISTCTVAMLYADIFDFELSYNGIPFALYIVLYCLKMYFIITFLAQIICIAFLFSQKKVMFLGPVFVLCLLNNNVPNSISEFSFSLFLPKYYLSASNYFSVPFEISVSVAQIFFLGCLFIIFQKFYFHFFRERRV